MTHRGAAPLGKAPNRISKAVEGAAAANQINDVSNRTRSTMSSTSRLSNEDHNIFLTMILFLIRVSCSFNEGRSLDTLNEVMLNYLPGIDVQNKLLLIVLYWMFM